MTVAMPFLQKLITFLWPPDIAWEFFHVYFPAFAANYLQGGMYR